MLKKILKYSLIIITILIVGNEVYLRFPRNIEFEEVGRVTNDDKEPFLDVRLLSNEKMEEEFLKYNNNLSELFNTIPEDYSIAVSYNGEITSMNYSLITEINGRRYNINKFLAATIKTNEGKENIIVYKYKSKYPILTSDEFLKLEFSKKRNRGIIGYLN